MLTFILACQVPSPTVTPTPGQAPTPTSSPLPSPTPTPRPTPTATATPTPAPRPPPGSRLKLESVAKGLEIPWSLAFAPDGRIFLTERKGAVRVSRDGRLLPDPWATLEVAVEGEGGLLGIALDPRFSENGYVYVYYTYWDARGGRWNRVARLTERAGRGADLTVILDKIPAASIHDGGRIKFGPDGLLYITTGDAANPFSAQDLGSMAGKILRIQADGSIPQDNPFPNSPVYSYGHRNPQGLAWHPTTRQLYSTEHGPQGRDELNLILPGGNYGWPHVVGIALDPRFRDPLMESGPDATWAPSGATFYTASQIPGWKGTLLFANLRGTHLAQVTLAPPAYDRATLLQKLFVGDLGRLRDVAEGPDGALYFINNNRDGRGFPTRDDDQLFKVSFAP
ncbi:MAG: PQQ-dependent sugar dehydrogenase [Chloroflexi bacterium]|nr:PQQ-dependent sugar dehydrogenase [Chloroflexota bacterium]